jgi:hypothetical protein
MQEPTVEGRSPSADARPEDARLVFSEVVAESIIKKMPRFIPKNTKLRLDREEAIARLEQCNRAGKVATVIAIEVR